MIEPLFEGHADELPPGSSCIGVAYTSRAKEIEAGEITGFRAFIATVVDSMGIANAFVLAHTGVVAAYKGAGVLRLKYCKVQ